MKKYKQVKVNLDFSVHEKLSIMADELGISLAELFRKSVGTSIENSREKKNEKRVHKVADPQLIYEVNKIGNNLNQISKHLNQGQKIDFEILNLLIEIQKNTKELL